MDDLISRQAAIDALAKMMPSAYTADGSHPADEAIFKVQEIFADCITALEILPSAQPDHSGEVTEMVGDTISRQAVEHLDWFTKLYCRDKSITDDLIFRCEQCEFELPDGRCLVKAMARKLCPDYKDFGAMGDL